MKISDLPFRLGVVSHEIDQDMDCVGSIAQELGMEGVDVKSVDGKSVERLSDEEAKQAYQSLRRFDRSVVMLAGPLFKSLTVEGQSSASLSETEAYQSELQSLRRTCEIARLFHTPYVRTFSFRRDSLVDESSIPRDTLHVVAAGLRGAAGVAAAYGVILLLENVKSCWANTGVNSARIIEATGSNNIKMAWDPPNAYVSGEHSFRVGYKAVKEYTQHVHIKDVKRTSDGFQWACIGQGDFDVAGQLRLLCDDNYAKTVTLETHWSPEGMTKMQATRTSFDGLLSAIKELPSRRAERIID